MNAPLTMQPTIVLTRPGGPWEIADDLRQKVCLTGDNILHIVDGYEDDPHLLAFENRLERSGVKFERRYVASEALHALYAGTGAGDGFGLITGSAATDISDRQQAVKLIFAQATAAGASDVHFFATPNGHHLRFRIHGVLETKQHYVGDDGYRLISSIYSSMCEQQGDPNFRPTIPQRARLKNQFVTEFGLFGARIETRPTLNGPWMAIRLLYDNGQAPELEEMGWLPSQIALMMRFIHRTTGMALLTGVTGAGKSTALQALLNRQLQDADYAINLVTIENPIEYRIPYSQQTPLSELGWAGDISNILRQDPDVVMVGEINNADTAAAAFQGVLTGHGLWSTLHTLDALTSLQRLIELGVERNLVTDPALVKGLVNQSLARVLCPHCKIPYLEHRASVREDVRQRVDGYCIPEQVFLRGAGCEKCNNRGVARRTAIAEVIDPDLQLMRVFREKGKAEAAAFWINEMGGITKNAHLITRINEGLIDPRMGEEDVGDALDSDRWKTGRAA